MLLHPLQALGEVKVDPLPQRLVLSGLAGPSVFTLDHGSSGHSERGDGGDEQLLVMVDGAQQPRRRETCDAGQGHLCSDLDDSLLGHDTEDDNEQSRWIFSDLQRDDSIARSQCLFTHTIQLFSG